MKTGSVSKRCTALLCQRAILAPRNEDANIINKQLLLELPGYFQVYKSIVTICSTDEAANYPTEFLNSLYLLGVSSHTLELKIGVQIMLLRNLHPPSLCSETRLCVKTYVKYYRSYHYD